jgi:hypothetical protein
MTFKDQLKYFDKEIRDKLSVPTLLLREESQFKPVDEKMFETWVKERLPTAIDELMEMKWVCLGCGKVAKGSEIDDDTTCCGGEEE